MEISEKAVKAIKTAHRLVCCDMSTNCSALGLASASKHLSRIPVCVGSALVHLRFCWFMDCLLMVVIDILLVLATMFER